MPLHAVVLQTPPARVGPGFVERAQPLAAEAVVSNGGYAALDAGLVLGMADPGGVDQEATGLGVLLEGFGDPRRDRVGLGNDGLGDSQAASHASMAEAVVSWKIG